MDFIINKLLQMCKMNRPGQWPCFQLKPPNWWATIIKKTRLFDNRFIIRDQPKWQTVTVQIFWKNCYACKKKCQKNPAGDCSCFDIHGISSGCPNHDLNHLRSRRQADHFVLPIVTRVCKVNSIKTNTSYIELTIWPENVATRSSVKLSSILSQSYSRVCCLATELREILLLTWHT